MRILITGSEGMLGNDARRYFAAAGCDVIGADVVGEESPSFVRMDITATEQVREAMLRIKPDVVLHAAAYTNVDGCERDADTAYRVNAIGTWNVAAAADAAGASLVAISTDYVFDGKKDAPYTEFDRTGPLGVYGASKLAGEEAALRQCARTYIVRTSWLYGIHGRNFAFTLLQRARQQGDQHVVADQFGTPTYTKDLVKAIAQIIRRPLYGIYHASNGGETSWRDFARAILDRSGLESVAVHPLTSAECAVRFNLPTERPAYSVMRNYAMELLGDAPMRPWADALEAFLAEAKAAGKI